MSNPRFLHRSAKTASARGERQMLLWSIADVSAQPLLRVCEPYKYGRPRWKACVVLTRGTQTEQTAWQGVCGCRETFSSRLKRLW